MSNKPLGGLTRTIDLTYDSNIFVIVVTTMTALLMGFKAFAIGRLDPIDLLSGTILVFISWSLARELDPDNARSANIACLAAACTTILMYPFYGYAITLLETDLKKAKLKHYSEVFQLKNEKDISIEKLIDLDPLIEGGKHKKYIDTVLLTEDGDPLYINFSVKPLINSRERIVGSVFIIHDKTKEKALDYAKEEFLSIASHQLRTPLGSMRWSLEMLIGGDVDDIGSKGKKMLEQIYKSNMRMITLVNDLLNISRIQQRRVKPEPIECNVVPIISEAITELKQQSSKRKIKINFNSNQSVKIKVDPKQFREVVQNLLSNSVKYNIEGGLIKVEISGAKKKFLLSISDNGIGIPHKAQNMIFKKFYRADNVTTMHTEGTGLGLFVVKSYIQSWGGRIWFQSPTIISKKEKRGTTFFVEIPLTKTQ